MEVDHLTIVGLGSIGRRYIRLIRQLRPEIEITLVRSGHGKVWAEEVLADRTVSNIDQAIDLGAKAAIICSPATSHVSQLSRFLDSGIHSLVEKPLAESYEATFPLIAEGEGIGAFCLVGYVLRFNESVISFKKFLSDLVVGDLISARFECGSYLPDWRGDVDYRTSVSASKKLGGGVLLELSHEVDLMLWFFGRASEIYARLHFSNSLEIDTEDSVEAIVAMKNRLPVSLHLDFNRRHPARFCTVYGIDGEMTLDLVQRQIVVKRIGRQPELLSFDRSPDQMYMDQLHHFFRCIEEADVPCVGVQEAREVLRVIDAARQSSQQLKSVSIN